MNFFTKSRIKYFLPILMLVGIFGFYESCSAGDINDLINMLKNPFDTIVVGLIGGIAQIAVWVFLSLIFL